MAVAGVTLHGARPLASRVRATRLAFPWDANERAKRGAPSARRLCHRRLRLLGGLRAALLAGGHVGVAAELGAFRDHDLGRADVAGEAARALDLHPGRRLAVADDLAVDGD